VTDRKQYWNYTNVNCQYQRGIDAFQQASNLVIVENGKQETSTIPQKEAIPE
jgi:hypothetical protein